MIVICGFTPSGPGTTLPSATNSRSTSCVSKSGPTTLVSGSVPMRHVPSGWYAVTSKALGDSFIADSRRISSTVDSSSIPGIIG